MSEIKDSGSRREYPNGAVRDMADGKGRCDLLPLTQISILKNDKILKTIGYFQESPYEDSRTYLRSAFSYFCSENDWTPTDAILEVAVHYEDGCKKYSENQWQGLPLSCFIDSAVRHYLKWLRGDKDERHDRAFLWNILGAMWVLDNRPEQCDMKGWNEQCE